MRLQVFSEAWQLTPTREKKKTRCPNLLLSNEQTNQILPAPWAKDSSEAHRTMGSFTCICGMFLFLLLNGTQTNI